jgi:hypothetical protein
LKIVHKNNFLGVSVGDRNSTPIGKLAARNLRTAITIFTTAHASTANIKGGAIKANVAEKITVAMMNRVPSERRFTHVVQSGQVINVSTGVTMKNMKLHSSPLQRPGMPTQANTKNANAEVKKAVKSPISTLCPLVDKR